MKKFMFIIDDFLYKLNQKVYDWLRNEFDIYVGTYRMVFLMISNCFMLLIDYTSYIESKSNLYIFISIGVFSTTVSYMYTHFMRDNMLQAKERYHELNAFANALHILDESFIIRQTANLVAIVCLMLNMFNITKLTTFINISTIIGQIWLYSLMVLVKPRIHKKSEVLDKDLSYSIE